MKKILKNKSGSSIVEVMVAFTIALMMFAMFNHVVTLSNTFIMKSHDKMQAQEKFNEAYYDSTKGTVLAVQDGSSDMSISLISQDRNLTTNPLVLDDVILQEKTITMIDGEEIAMQSFGDKQP